MKLTGPQTQQLHAALMNAFTTRPALERMVRFGLGENLNEFAGGDNLSDAVFRLITWGESQGRLLELLAGACTENPTNEKLTQVAEKLHADLTAAAEAAAQALPAAPPLPFREPTNPEGRQDRFAYDIFFPTARWTSPLCAPWPNGCAPMACASGLTNGSSSRAT